MDRLSYGAYLYALEPDVLAVLTMHGEILHDPAISSGFDKIACWHHISFGDPTPIAATGWHWLQKAFVGNGTHS